MTIEGYVDCHRCGAWVVREAARRTGGLCASCIDAVRDQIGTMEIVIGGKLVKVRTHEPRGGSKGDPNTAKAAAKAREKARKRLSRLFPAVFEVLVADERARAGIEPWPIEQMTWPMDADELDREVRGLWATWMEGESYPAGDGVPVHPPVESSE